MSQPLLTDRTAARSRNFVTLYSACFQAHKPKADQTFPVERML